MLRTYTVYAPPGQGCNITYNGIDRHAAGARYALTIGGSGAFYCDRELELAISELTRYAWDQWQWRDLPVQVYIQPGNY